jgi:hypothetical protein
MLMTNDRVFINHIMKSGKLDEEVNYIDDKLNGYF